MKFELKVLMCLWCYMAGFMSHASIWITVSMMLPVLIYMILPYDEKQKGNVCKCREVTLDELV